MKVFLHPIDVIFQVVLETEITNKPALRLYENLGFVRDKRLFRYYLNGVDALRLKLWLRWRQKWTTSDFVFVIVSSERLQSILRDNICRFLFVSIISESWYEQASKCFSFCFVLVGVTPHQVRSLIVNLHQNLIYWQFLQTFSIDI